MNTPTQFIPDSLVHEWIRKARAVADSEVTAAALDLSHCDAVRSLAEIAEDLLEQVHPLRLVASSVAGAALFVASYAEAACRRIDTWYLHRFEAHPDECSLCGGKMAPWDLRSGVLHWHRCTDCGLHQVGVRPGDVAA